MCQKHHYFYPNQFFKFLIKVILCEVLTVSHVFALLPPPPPPRILTLEEQLQMADIVVVGVFDKYVFIGTNYNNNEEYLSEFNIAGENRRRQAIIKVKKVFYTTDDYSSLRQIRIDYPTNNNSDDAPWDRGDKIFILKKGWVQPSATGTNLIVFKKIIQPLPRKENEKKIRKIININRQQSNK